MIAGVDVQDGRAVFEAAGFDAKGALCRGDRQGRDRGQGEEQEGQG
jgi:hypothetical protein